MAVFTANRTFDFNNFDLSQFSATTPRWSFLNDAYVNIGDMTYRDVSYVTVNTGIESNLYMLGEYIRVGRAFRAEKGGIDALMQSTGGGFADTDWAITELVTVPVKTILKAMRSDKLTDDAALLVKLLAGDDSAELSTGNDRFNGFAGNDSIDGGAGSDTLWGGLGADELTGGTGSDVFVFDDRDSGMGEARDIIFDFDPDEDIIDLSLIDANTRSSGDQSFAFSGTVAAANSVWYLYLGETTTIFGDVNGDARADFAIEVTESTVPDGTLIL